MKKFLLCLLFLTVLPYGEARTEQEIKKYRGKQILSSMHKWYKYGDEAEYNDTLKRPKPCTVYTQSFLKKKSDKYKYQTFYYIGLYSTENGVYHYIVYNKAREIISEFYVSNHKEFIKKINELKLYELMPSKNGGE